MYITIWTRRRYWCVNCPRGEEHWNHTTTKGVSKASLDESKNITCHCWREKPVQIGYTCFSVDVIHRRHSLSAMVFLASAGSFYSSKNFWNVGLLIGWVISSPPFRVSSRVRGTIPSTIPTCGWACNEICFRVPADLCQGSISTNKYRQFFKLQSSVFGLDSWWALKDTVEEKSSNVVRDGYIAWLVHPDGMLEES